MKHNDRGQTIYFGSDWSSTMSSSKNSETPENAGVSDLSMTVSPVAGVASRSISTALFNGIVELAQSGRRGVPFDLALAAWSYANRVAVHVFTKGGVPRMRLHNGTLTIRFSEPKAVSLDPDQTQTHPTETPPERNPTAARHLLQETKMPNENIEFARLSRPYIDPRAPGAPIPSYPSRELGAWQTRDVPVAIANVCRELSRRGQHGVYIEAIGGPDILAELDLHGLPYKLTSNARRGVFGNKNAWVVPNAVYRFVDDREGVIQP